MGGRVEETGIEFRIFCSDTMLNYQISQNLKLLRYGKFDNLINTSNRGNCFKWVQNFDSKCNERKKQAKLIFMS